MPLPLRAQNSKGSPRSGLQKALIKLRRILNRCPLVNLLVANYQNGK